MQFSGENLLTRPTIISDPLKLNSEKLYFDCGNFFSKKDIYLKIEGFNLTGSIKLKTAIGLIEGLEKRIIIRPGTNKIVESSSGNLGVALSFVCLVKGYEFFCVVDPNTSDHCINQIQAYGGKIITVNECDKNGGYLTARINKVKEILQSSDEFVWTNQYANNDNSSIHFEMTAREIYESFPDLDYLFVGTGTTGTIRGCANFFHIYNKELKIVAVEPIGSVTFGAKPGKRFLPGLGTSRRPEIFSNDYINEVIQISEKETVEMCNNFLKNTGLMVGASSGTVLAAIRKYQRYFSSKDKIVGISPDLGQNYLNTVYNKRWGKEKLGIS